MSTLSHLKLVAKKTGHQAVGANQFSPESARWKTLRDHEIPLNQRQRSRLAQASGSAQAHLALVVSKRDWQSLCSSRQIQQLDH